MKKIKKLKVDFLSRNISLAKIATKLGTNILTSKKTDLLEKASEVLGKQAKFLTSELGSLKGSFLKAGQLLSLYSQDLLPKELSKILSELQSESSYLEWEQIKKQIPKEIIEKLTISPEAFAAASIGQVHLATNGDLETIALKIQYPGIEKMIKTDLKVLKIIVNMINIVPIGINLDEVFGEIEKMLIQEMNYEKEQDFHLKFKSLSSEEFIVPKLYQEFCSNNVLATEYIEGESIQNVVEKLDQETRNKLGISFFNLFLKEIFDWRIIQTDSHFGNYLIKDDKWVLLDFGACKELNNELAEFYMSLFEVFLDFDEEKLLDMAKKFGAINIEETDIEFFTEYCRLLSRPLEGRFDWGSADIVTEAMSFGKQFYQKVKFNFLPHENLFIDRKFIGVYYMLKLLKADIDLSTILQEKIQEKNAI